MRKDANEDTIRHRLIDHLKVRESEESVFISELCIDAFSRRADLVVANGCLSAYEIKSASDDTARLEGQLSVYQDYFEAVTVVSAEKHVDWIRSSIPQRFGLWVIDENGAINEVRSAAKNRIAKTNWISFLPVDVLRTLAAQHGISVKGDRYELERRCLRNVTLDALRAFVLSYFQFFREKRIARLKKRQNLTSLDFPLSKFLNEQTQKERDTAISEFAAGLNGQNLTPIPRKTA